MPSTYNYIIKYVKYNYVDFGAKIKLQDGAMATKATEERRQRVAAAEKAVETRQLSLRVAGERFDLPKSTIHRHVQGKSMQVGAGRPTALTKEEKSIVRSCKELAELGFGIDRITVGRVVRDYLQSQERDNPFKDGVPGKKWWRGFLKRWPSLSERKPQHFPVTRAQASCPEVMDNYFKNLQVNYIHNTYSQGNDIQIYASYKLYRDRIKSKHNVN